MKQLLFLSFFLVAVLQSSAQQHRRVAIMDSLDSDGYAVKVLKWKYKGSWSWPLTIPGSVVKHYRSKPRLQWEGDFDYFAKYVEPNDKAAQTIAESLERVIANYKKIYHWTYEDEIMFVVAMIQQMKYENDDDGGYEKYPAETIFDGAGDCEDKAILAASLLKRLGYDVSLLFLENEDKTDQHIALGVALDPSRKGTFFEESDQAYYYVETTSAGWGIGEIPKKWQGAAAIVIEVR